ncbi:unnamed protein product [Gulo gulo]|uniref:Uncharacterized protein n=1 Tax=Gulo gulo TaxID=48420 RepID=A0A9X9LZW1_GULGU|nr:unnamed protein product [Gulo gulo]
MVQDNYLSCEASCFHWWVIFAVSSHNATTNTFDRYVLDLEAHTVPGRASFKASWCTSTDFTSVVTMTRAKVTTMPDLRTPVFTQPTGRERTNTTNFVDILERQTQGLVS